MPRTIGYFKYKTRTAIEIYGSGIYELKADSGYVYGWTEALPDFTLRAYIKTFTKATNNADAGLMFRTQANANVAHISILMGGDNIIRVKRRALTNSTTDIGSTATLSVHEGVWVQMVKVGNTITLQYSLNTEITAPASITWTTLQTISGATADWPTLEKYLCCSSGGDNVNLAYFTKVYTDDCWIAPTGQKED